MPCSALAGRAWVQCVVAGRKITVSRARRQFHYRAGDMRGDVPPETPGFRPSLRPENAPQCSQCGRCMD